MAMPKYRVIDVKGAYMARDVEPVLLSLGADHTAAAVYNIRAPVYQLVMLGEEIETDQPPGPHLEPLNAEARERLDAYWANNPNATLDPTRRMPLGQDPMGGRTIEQLVSSLLDGMDRDAAARAGGVGAQPGADGAGLAAAVQALAEGQAAMLQALTAVLAAQTTPAGKGRAA